MPKNSVLLRCRIAKKENVVLRCSFWTDVSPFPNFNNSVLTTRRNLLLHC